MPKENKSIWQKFNDRAVPGSGDECWGWTGQKSTCGYAVLWHGKYCKPRTLRAHRVSFEMFKGPIPQGLHIDHLCRNRGCVNPAHLEAVTQRENVLRGMGCAARNARRTQCLYGHEYDSTNSRGSRACSICKNKSAMDYYFRQKASKRGGRDK